MGAEEGEGDVDCYGGGKGDLMDLLSDCSMEKKRALIAHDQYQLLKSSMEVLIVNS